jgi:hypothetical protein
MGGKDGRIQVRLLFLMLVASITADSLTVVPCGIASCFETFPSSLAFHNSLRFCHL